MAEHVGKDPQTYAEEFSAFYKDLKSFHDLRGSSYSKLPQLHGHEVDLYLLYSLVTSRGGWEKVNANGDWENLLPYFGIHRLCANGAIALKQIYIRYLDLYERVHFHGEEVDRRELDLHDEDDARSRRRALRLLHATPISYNLQQHFVADNIRRSNGLSVENIQVSPAERIFLSLLCPLPNEQDFAINICSLLAMETRKSFPLQECPRIIDAILAHAGVFSQVSLRKHFIECYRKFRGQNLEKFWHEVVPEADICQLSEEDLHDVQEEDHIVILKSTWNSSPPLSPEQEDEDIPASPCSTKQLNTTVDANESLPGDDIQSNSLLDKELHVVPQPTCELNLTGDQKRVESSSAAEHHAGANSPVYRNGHLADELCIDQDVQLETHQENTSSSVFETSAFHCQNPTNAPSGRTSFTHQEKNQSENIVEYPSESQNSVGLLGAFDASTSQGPEAQFERKFVTKSKLPTAVLKPDNPRAVDYWLKQRKMLPKNQKVEMETIVDESATEDWDMFHYQREMGVHDALGQRVLQVLNVIRNLSFDESNSTILAQSEPCMRLLLLAAHAKWSCLPQLALDAISNLAIEIILKDPANSTISAILLETIVRGLESEDRFTAMRCIETLGRLALKSENESQLLMSIEPRVYERLCSFLTVPDVALLIYALECVYSLSSLGQAACNALLKCSGALDVLISLLTVEAQSYGSKARILMNVVETVADGETVPSLTHFSNMQPTARLSQTGVQLSVPSATPSTVVQPSAKPPSPLQSSKVAPNQSFSRPSTPTQAKPNTAIISQPERESAAVQWLKGTYEPLVGAPSIEQNVLYRHYVGGCSKNGQRQPLGMVQFLSCVRSTFGQNVGPFRKQVGSSVEYYFEGMSPKSQSAAASNSATAIETSHPQNGDLPNSPILKAQLSAPPKSTNQKDKHNSSTEPASNLPVGNTVQPSSSLIKSLLANKVQDNGPQNAGHLVTPPQTSTLIGMTNSMNSHVLPTSVQNSSNSTNVQVAQRQQQQKLQQERESIAAAKNAKVINEKANGTLLVSSTSETGTVEKPASKGMLADLLERDLKKQYATGTTEQHDKELRIGDRGLELISKNSSGIAVIKDNVDEVRTSANAPKSSLIAEIDDSGHVQIHLEEETDTPSVCNGKSLLEQLEACDMDSVSDPVPPPVLDRHTKRPADNEDELAVSTKKAKHENGGSTTTTQLGNEISKEPQSDEANKLPNGQLTGHPIVSTNSLSIQPATVGNPTSSQPPRAFLIIQPHTQAKSTPQSQRFMLAIQRPTGTLHHVAVPGNLVAIPTNQILANGNAINIGNLGTHAATLEINNQSNNATPATTAASNVKMGSSAVTAAVTITSTTNVPSATHVSATPSISSNPSAVASQTLACNSPTSLTITSSIEGVVTFSGGAFAFPARPTETASRLPNVMESTVTITPVPASAASAASSCTATSASVSATSPALGQRNNVQDATKVKPKPTAGVKAQSTTTPGNPSDLSYQFMCEWKDCMRSFKTPNDVYIHACQTHCPAHLDEITCLWDHCDGLKRKRFSMMTHLMDRHCNDEMQKLLAARRFQMSTHGKTDIPAPQAPTPHPGYAPHAAFHAIKRHAAESLAQKEYEEKEGPVTKSIRLTSALILRNFAAFSPLGRKCLQRFETHLAGVALSNVESSRTIAQVLYELTQQRS